MHRFDIDDFDALGERPAAQHRIPVKWVIFMEILKIYDRPCKIMINQDIPG